MATKLPTFLEANRRRERLLKNAREGTFPVGDEDKTYDELTDPLVRRISRRGTPAVLSPEGDGKSRYDTVEERLEAERAEGMTRNKPRVPGLLIERNKRR